MTRWCACYRHGQIYQAFSKVVRAYQKLEHWVYRQAVLFQSCEIDVTVMLYPGSQEEQRNGHE